MRPGDVARGGGGAQLRPGPPDQPGCSAEATGRTGRPRRTSSVPAAHVDGDGGQRAVPQHRVGVGDRVPAHAAVRRGGGSSRRRPPRAVRGCRSAKASTRWSRRSSVLTPSVLARQPPRPAVGDEVVGAHQHAVRPAPAGPARPGTARPRPRRPARRRRSARWRPWSRPAEAIATASPASRRPSRIARLSRCTGWPIRRRPRPPPRRRAWCSMLSITPTPRSLTPILASIPNSVTVRTSRPSGNGIVQVNQPSRHRVVPVPGLYGDRRPPRRQGHDRRALGLAGRVRGDQDLGARVDRRDLLHAQPGARRRCRRSPRRGPGRAAGWSPRPAPTTGPRRRARSRRSRTAGGSGRRCRRSRWRTGRRARRRARAAPGRRR